MDEQVKRIFVFEIERQAKFAVIASSDLEQALRDGGNIDAIWYSVQAFLVAAGNLSKLLWPIERYAERGRELRDSFDLKDDSVLAPRRFRNHAAPARMTSPHVYEIRPRKDKRGVDLISGVLPFGALWYGEPDAISNAIGYAKFFSRSHDAVIRVYDEAGNVIETHEHKGDFKEW
jgi:hypothetical protein